MDADPLCDSGHRGHHAIVQLVIAGLRFHGDQRFVARLLSRLNVHKHHVVIERERGNRRAVHPLQVVQRPAFSVTLKSIVRIVANQVAIHHL